MNLNRMKLIARIYLKRILKLLKGLLKLLGIVILSLITLFYYDAYLVGKYRENRKNKKERGLSKETSELNL